MKMLILGHSRSDGVGVEADDRTVLGMLRREAVGPDGLPWQVVHEQLIPTPSAPAHVRRMLDEHDPDVVLLLASGWSFGMRTVYYRVARLLSGRTFRWYTRASAATGRAKLRPAAAARELVRAVAARTIGIASMLDRETVERAYQEVLRELSLREDVIVAVSGGTFLSTMVQRRNPNFIEEAGSFQRALRDEVERRHFDWIDEEAAVSRASDRDSLWPRDGLHMTEQGHRVCADLYRDYLSRRFTPALLAEARA